MAATAATMGEDWLRGGSTVWESGRVRLGIGVTRAIGREPELAAVRGFLGADASVGTLVLTGGPGIGKTTVWDAGIALAQEMGWRVLCARPSGAEARLSFAALIDLLDGVGMEALAVPAPQRAALEAALLRVQPTGVPAQPQAIALGL